MYPTSGAVIRGDLNIVVEEASAADQFHIGLQVMPAMSVGLKSGTHPKIQLAEGELLTSKDTARGDDGSYSEIVRAYTADTYDCVDRGLEERVDDADQRDLARFFSLESAAARLTRRNVALAHETRVAAAINSTANFGAATNSAVAYTEANIATINFPLDVYAAIERVNAYGAMANTIVMGSTVFARIRRANLTVSHVRGSLVGQLQTPIDSSAIAASFRDAGIEHCYIGRARYNSANKKAAYSASSIWGTTYVWVGYTNPSAATAMDGGAGFTFYWNEDGGLFTTETYRDEKRRSNMVRVRHNVIEKVTDGTAGTLIATQYS